MEANPLLIPVLNRTVENLRAHDHGENTYEVRAAAVSDVPDAIEFHISRFPTLSSVTPNAEAETLRVPTLHLDELHVPGLRTLIKVDVEGAEYRAIRSGSRFLQSHETSFFVELHSWGDRSIRKYPLHVCWLFLRYGFALRKIGTHYFFYPAPLFRRLTSFVSELPSLALKYLVCRFAPRLQLAIQRLRDKSVG